MNTIENSNYIQYLTQSGQVKTKEVVFEGATDLQTFTISGINEYFFIFSAFQNNIKLVGVGFETSNNLDMLGFINSDFADLSLVPVNAYFPPLEVVTLTYSKLYMEQHKAFSTNVVFPQPQIVYVNLPVSAPPLDMSAWVKNIVKDLVPFNLSGVDVETVTKSYLISANSFKLNDIIFLKSLGFLRTLATGSYSVKLYVNTVDNLVGAVKIGTYNMSREFTKIKRSFALDSGNLIGVNFNASLMNDEIDSVDNFMSSTPFNPAIDNYFITTLTLYNLTMNVKQFECVITN